METDPHGNPVPKYRTEVRTGWTAQNLYFLFVCPYEQLNLRPNPKTSTETYGLWNWEVWPKSSSVPISRMKWYKEFEISPQGEWPIPSTSRSALDCWNSPRKINAETRASEHTHSVSPHAVAYLCSTARM